MGFIKLPIKGFKFDNTLIPVKLPWGEEYAEWLQIRHPINLHKVKTCKYFAEN